MSRSTKAEMYVRYQAILEFTEEQKPVTVRQVYYNLAAKSLVPKTQNGYQKVARACQYLRREGLMPWEWVVDNSRWMRKPTTHDSVQDAKCIRPIRTPFRSICRLCVVFPIDESHDSGVSFWRRCRCYCVFFR